MECLLKVSLITILFYSIYKLLLVKETFFTANRWFLLSGLFLAFVIPLITIPVYTETIISPIEITPAKGNVELGNNTESSTFNYLKFISFTYTLGLLFFGVRFIINISSLIKLLINNKPTEDSGYKLVETTKNNSPFSFFRWIVYNPNQFTNNELEQILIHEKAHANQHHSIDNIVVETTSIILWFNPIVWLYKNSIQQNLEYIADNITNGHFKSTKSYQQLLLKTSLESNTLVLTNTFYNSLIKKRIVMLHKNKSKKVNQLKILLTLPILAIFMFFFNTKIIAQNSVKLGLESIIVNNKTTSESIIIHKNTPDLELDYLNKRFKNNYDIDLTYIIKRNVKDEITYIKMSFIDKTGSLETSQTNNEPIEPFEIDYNPETKVISTNKIKMGRYKNTNKLDNANSFKITGTITDEIGNPIQGAIVASNNSGVKTNDSGKYTIKTSIGEKITFSYMSLIPQQITVKNKGEINIALISKSRLIIDANSKTPKFYYKGKEISKSDFKDNYFSQNKNTKTNSNTTKELVISGTIKDELGKPIKDAIVLNEELGVKTNKYGKFSIKVANGNQLIISKKGLKSQKITINNNKNIEVVLKKN